MTLANFFHSSLSLPLRWPVKLAISAVAAVYPGSLPQLAKKMRELFSPRLNDLLYEYLFLYNTKLGNFASIKLCILEYFPAHTNAFLRKGLRAGPFLLPRIPRIFS